MRAPSLVTHVVRGTLVGECQESGRDQGHTQLGIFNLVEAAFTVQCYVDRRKEETSGLLFAHFRDSWYILLAFPES